MTFGSRGSKTPSKRKTIKLKNTIKKKAAAKKWKVKKLLRKDPTGLKKARRKDPGIPNSFPLKGALLADIERRRIAEEAARQERRELLRRERGFLLSEHKTDEPAAPEEVNSDSEAPEDEVDMSNEGEDAKDDDEDMYIAKNCDELMQAAAQARHAFDTAQAPSKEAQGTRRNPHFFKELKKVVAKADILLEVLDARDPDGCRCKSTEDSILTAGKKLVFVINKIDLVPSDVLKRWMNYLKCYGPVIAVKSATAQRARDFRGDAFTATDKQKQSTAQALGFDALTQLLKNYARDGSGKKTSKLAVTVGVIGYPNVGKSSIINSMKWSAKVVKVGAEAGVTRHLQEVKIDSTLTLIDSPGVLFSGDDSELSNVLRNSVKVTSVKDPLAVLDSLVQTCPADKLMKFYEVRAFRNTSELAAQVARKRGRLGRGGAPDVVAAARSILQDWTSGKIEHYLLPPVEAPSNDEATIVPQLAQEFDLSLP